MSSPSSRVILSPRARQDFRDILRYTVETWGEDQMLTYRFRLDDALQMIGRNPQAGHRSAELPETHRLYLAGSHVIIYRMLKDAVAVVRILHQRMSLVRSDFKVTKNVTSPSA